MILADRIARTARAFGLLAALGPAAAAGQVFTALELNVSNPGARSLGFGGAFVALADDATAAFANPAGLVQITRPEVSAEGRSWSTTSLYTRGGRAAGTPTGLGIDTVAFPLEAVSSDDLTGLSFLSFVYPRGRWSFAVFRHQWLNFEMSQEIQGIFTTGSVVAGSERGPIERAFWDMEVTTHGVAAAYRVGERLSLGVGLQRFDAGILITGSDYLWDEDTVESYFAEASFLPERRLNTVGFGSDGDDWGVSAGFLWTLSQRWRLGGVFRRGPEFRFTGRFEAGPAGPPAPPDLGALRTGTPWRFPDVWGLGVTWRSPGSRWSASFEWDRVEYSTILESLDPRLRDPNQVVDDGDQLRLGAEYAFLQARPLVALRLGLWHDPDHRIRSESDEPIFRAENLPGEDELHFAAGLGIAFESFQIDLGIDLSERIDTAALSAIYSF